MRMLCKVRMTDMQTANRAIQDGVFAKTLQATAEMVKPEAMYFIEENGTRTALIFFDMKDSMQIPVIAEPFFMTLNAQVEFHPAMNADDVAKGLRAVMEKR